jgi:hypothetical protein
LVSSSAKLAASTRISRYTGGANSGTGARSTGGIHLAANGAGVRRKIRCVVSRSAVSATGCEVARIAPYTDGRNITLAAMSADDVARTANSRIRIEPHSAGCAASIHVAQSAAVAKRYGEPDSAESAIGGRAALIAIVDDAAGTAVEGRSGVCVESGRAGGASWSKESLCACGAGRDNCANITVYVDFGTGIASSARSIAVESAGAVRTSSTCVF